VLEELHKLLDAYNNLLESKHAGVLKTDRFCDVFFPAVRALEDAMTADIIGVNNEKRPSTSGE